MRAIPLFLAAALALSGCDEPRPKAPKTPYPPGSVYSSLPEEAVELQYPPTPMWKDTDPISLIQPDRLPPSSRSECPATHPIKGNRASMIYHLPGQEFYGRTNPEDCFFTPEAAERHGYRRSRV